MTHLPPDEEQWQEFLHKHRPTPPPAAPDLEERLMNAIATSQPPDRGRQLWTVPSAIAAGLLMAWSGYRFLIPLSQSSNSASLEAFLENNWNSVVEDAPATQTTNVPTDGTIGISMAQ